MALPRLPAVREVAERLGVPPDQLAVIGGRPRDRRRLGRLGGSGTILVRSGMSGQIDVDRIA